MGRSIDLEHRYFIIALIHANDYERLYKLFTRSRMKVLSPSLKQVLKETKEVKATQLWEGEKRKIYEDIVRLCEDIEIGIIVIDSATLPERFRMNKARCFTYALMMYLERYKFVSRFGEDIQISLVIDNQNIAKKGTYTLQEYLNIELYVKNVYEDEFKVSYRDSKCDNLIQFADYIANSTLRALYNNPDAVQNMEILRPILVEKKLISFDFPVTK